MQTKQQQNIVRNQPGYVNYLGSVTAASHSHAIYRIAKQSAQPLLIITNESTAVEQLARELHYFSANDDLTIVTFPDWETLPYDRFSPHVDLIAERLTALYQIQNLQCDIIIVSSKTLMTKLPPVSYLQQSSLMLTTGQELDLIMFRDSLICNGYIHVTQVMEHGEFTIRGSILDLYPNGSELPLRIDLFDQEIDSIRTFDPVTQRSHATIDNIKILPAKEYPLNRETLDQIVTARWQELLPTNSIDSALWQTLQAGSSFAGIEYYLPLFFTTTNTLFDYLPSSTQIVRQPNLEDYADSYWQEITERYEQLRYDIEHPILPPHTIFLPTNAIFTNCKRFTQIELTPKQKGATNCFTTKIIPDIAIKNKTKPPLLLLQNYTQQIAKQSKPTLICANSPGRKEILHNLLSSSSIQPQLCASWQDFEQTKQQLSLSVAPFITGFETTDFVIITETEIFGQQVIQQREARRTEQDPETMIHDLTELKVGDPVVHVDHGIGRYIGLETITTENFTADFMAIEYLNDAKLYVPISALHLISRYMGTNNETVTYNQLGSKQWQRTKQKATMKIRDTAAELLAIHADRASKKGFIYKILDDEYNQFSSSFSFTTTKDQQRAIDQTIADMTSSRSMDRLICGDVGFGKTEVAMRAAFVAVSNKKQVAVLVPTTLLAQQHYDNFSDRFADWPVNIAMLSRFNSAKQQQTTLQKLATGSVDIIIGTHRLLQANVKFHQLGLVIIDEEHRFGVRQKERLKALKTDIDILTLTATPIPRTLSLALASVRELSIIATPPERRLAIKTFVKEHNNQIVREAILREIWRGGQVYFLHNDVSTINTLAAKLSELVPEARIKVGHGQMREKELEQITHDFYHQRFNVLVATTIIESGIDIPTANTIIINRADRFGLAQLHQLRGRVGRSHHQAYAYLIVPPRRLMTSNAKKRLEAIVSMDDLGAGFTLATHDLEIRGAGEILGEEQSGQIQAIGYNLYLELLEQAVAALKVGNELMPDIGSTLGCDIDLNMPALIPETYIANVNTRLGFYKRLAGTTNPNQLRDLKIELIDRFGLLPKPTDNLFALHEIRQTAQRLGIAHIKLGQTSGIIEFNSKPKVAPEKIIQLLQNAPARFKLTGDNKLHFTAEDASDVGTKISLIKELVRRLS